MREFIDYEQALELKELGFNEECIDKYDPRFGKLSSNMETWSNEYYPESLMIPAPLYQQVFRWFRDVHGLNGVIEGSKKHGFEWCIFPDLDYYVKPPNNFNTYEEAEIECLKRLMEIVKNKQHEENF